MAPEKTFEIHLPSTIGAEKVAMEFAATVARSMSFSADRVELRALQVAALRPGDLVG